MIVYYPIIITVGWMVLNVQGIKPKLVVRSMFFFNWKYPDTRGLDNYQVSSLIDSGKSVLRTAKTQDDFNSLVRTCTETLSNKEVVNEYNKRFENDKDKLRLPKNKEELTKYAVLFLLSRYPYFEGRISR